MQHRAYQLRGWWRFCIAMWEKAPCVCSRYRSVRSLSKTLATAFCLGLGLLDIERTKAHEILSCLGNAVAFKYCFEALLFGVCFANVFTCQLTAFLYNAHTNCDHVAPSILCSLRFVGRRHGGQGRLVSAVGDRATRKRSSRRCICIFCFCFAGCADIASHWRVGDFGGRISLSVFSLSRERLKCISRFPQVGLWVFEEAVCTITNWDPTQMQTRLLEVCIIMELCRIMLKLFLRWCFRRHIRGKQPRIVDFITIASWISSHLFSWHHPALDGSMRRVSICHTSTLR